MQLQPYHRRTLIIRQFTGYPDYHSALGTASMQRWWPLRVLLQQRFRGGKGFSDYEVGALIWLRREYEEGVGRKG